MYLSIGNDYEHPTGYTLKLNRNTSRFSYAIRYNIIVLAIIAHLFLKGIFETIYILFYKFNYNNQFKIE